MKSADAQGLLAQIGSAISDIDSFNGASALEQAYLAKFLVVFICGIYEESIERIVNEMIARKTSNDQALCGFFQEYVKNTFRNPDIGNIKGLLNKFDRQYATAIEAFSETNKSALNSIIGNKNALAHGYQQVTVTLSDVKAFYRDSRPIIEKIDDILL